jgi:hypothetical protein
MPTRFDNQHRVPAQFEISSWPRLWRLVTELLPDYEPMYERHAYLPKSTSEPARARVRELARAHGIRDRRGVKLAPPPIRSSSS